jgi:hypothetical protein
VKQYRDSENTKDGWKFMESINMGSFYMQQKEPPSSSKPFPASRDIGKIIRCFNEWPGSTRRGHADSDYSYLSEFVHPNMAAFSHYYAWEPDQTKKKTVAKLIHPPRKIDSLPLPQVTIATAATLWSLRKLLEFLGEQEFAGKLSQVFAALMTDSKNV